MGIPKRWSRSGGKTVVQNALVQCPSATDSQCVHWQALSMALIMLVWSIVIALCGMLKSFAIHVHIIGNLHLMMFWASSHYRHIKLLLTFFSWIRPYVIWTVRWQLLHPQSKQKSNIYVTSIHFGLGALVRDTITGATHAGKTYLCFQADWKGNQLYCFWDKGMYVFNPPPPPFFFLLAMKTILCESQR